MKCLYLVRHAVAEERGPAWPDDTLRPLTERGQRRFARAATGFVRLEGVPDSILTSPLVRARQTAEIAGESTAEARLGKMLAVTAEAFRTPVPVGTTLAATQVRILTWPLIRRAVMRQCSPGIRPLLPPKTFRA